MEGMRCGSRARRAIVASALAAGVGLGAVRAAGAEQRIVEAAAALSAEGIRRHTAVLGSDAMEGRAPGTPGGGRAADYIADELERLGVRPLGDEGSYFQQVPLHGNTPLPVSRLILTSLGEPRELALWSDYVLVSTGAQTWLPRSAPMVFVGYGIVAPEFDANDYADVDVRGKVVVYLAGEPASDDPAYFQGLEPSVYAAAETKQRIALSRGAVGSVLIPDAGVSGAGWERLRREYDFEHLTAASSLPRHLSLVLHPQLAPALFADALYDFDRVRSMARAHTLRSFHLPVSLSFEGVFRSRTFLTPNVVGWIEGRDPELAGTAVVVSAHYDHLGVGPPVNGDAIYNGAVDNALGVSGVLEIARVVAALDERPRRSLIVLFTTAEEEGNLGAVYFLDHAPLPLSRLVANINVDGLAFLDRFGDVIGIGAELSELGSMLESAARELGVEVGHAEGVVAGHEAYMRSDQAAFAEAGVPAILVNEGFRWRSTTPESALRQTVEWLDEVYHSPADDLEQPLDFAASRQHCGVVLALLLTVADSPVAPQWRPGVPYAYQRLLSLADETQ
jgi:hypothetical protein